MGALRPYIDYVLLFLTLLFPLIFLLLATRLPPSPSLLRSLLLLRLGDKHVSSAELFNNEINKREDTSKRLRVTNARGKK